VVAVAAGRDTEQHGIRDGEEGERGPGNGGPVDTRSPLSLRLSLRHAVILSGIAAQPKDYAPPNVRPLISCSFRDTRPVS